MKKLFLITALIIGLGVTTIARENITAEEASTVDQLMQLGVIDKDRTAIELNQPLSAIDAMSMEMKGLQVTKDGIIARDKEIIERLNTKIVNLEDEVLEQKKEFQKYEYTLQALKKAKEDTDKIYAVIGLFLFLVGAN